MADLAPLRAIPILDVALGLGLDVEKGRTRCFRRERHKNGDAHPSLAVPWGKGNRWRCPVCDAGGSTLDLVMEVLGLSLEDAATWLQERFPGAADAPPRPSGQAPRVVARYGYHDPETGTLLFRSVRWAPGRDGRPKSFTFERPDGRGGWIPGLDGVPLRPLFRARDLLVSSGEVWVCEGERDCEAGASVGLATTCNPGGAGKWRCAHADFLSRLGRPVRIIPDPDEPGRRHAGEVAASLFGRVPSLKVVDLGADLSDFLAAGGTREELERRASEAPEWEPKVEELERCEKPRLPIICLADVEPREVRWLWHPYIPLGKLTLLEGDPGEGKSHVALAIATALSLGKGPPGLGPFEPAKTLIFSAEDDPEDTIRPRLDAMGADVSRAFAYKAPEVFDADGLKRVEAAIAEVRPLLVVVDPIVAYTGAKVDLWRPNEVRAILAALADLAARHGCAILPIRHLTKGRADRPIYRGLGSIDFTAAVRSVLLAGHDPDDQERKALVHIKCNLAALGGAIGYTLADGRFGWTGSSDLTAERILAAGSGEDGASALQEAEEFLREMLRDGPQASRALMEGAKHQGIAVKTLKRAKKSLGVHSKREGFGGGGEWLWILPEPHRGPTGPIEGQEKVWPPMGDLAPYGGREEELDPWQ